MNINIDNIGLIIKELRTKKGLSQEQLSILSDMERSQLSKLEAGQLKGVQFATILKLLEFLDSDVKLAKLHKNELKIHPFVKWAGGKTQILDKLFEYIPTEFNRYFGPFVGGGALLFAIQPKKFFINDFNSELTDAYLCFSNDILFSELKKKLIEHEKNHSDEYYYQIRELDRTEEFKNFSKSERAARLIYLNKACFNGLYRVNSQGYFNVPSGKKTSVNSFDRESFNDLRIFFRNKQSHIKNQDFAKFAKKAKSGDFVYFDPPYDSYEDKNSFTSYSKDDFGREDQIRLAECFRELDKKGVKVMLSNHNTKLINELYEGYNIHVISAKRMINAKGDGRGNVEEVIITNYEN